MSDEKYEYDIPEPEETLTEDGDLMPAEAEGFPGSALQTGEREAMAAPVPSGEEEDGAVPEPPEKGIAAAPVSFAKEKGAADLALSAKERNAEEAAPSAEEKPAADLAPSAAEGNTAAPAPSATEKTAAVSPDSSASSGEKKDAAVLEKPKALSDEAVLKHTASLWKYLPVPETEPDPMPEYRSSVKQYPGSRVIAARVRGKKHKHEGTNCDDWFETASYGRITFAAVSDGAGSKKFSRVGARESCRAAVGYLAASFEKLFSDSPQMAKDLKLPLSEAGCMEACRILAGTVQRSVMKAYEAVEAAYYSRAADPAYGKLLGRSLDLKDFSGTLLIAVLIPVSETGKEHLVITCQIGDGMIAMLNTKGEFGNSLKLMGVPDSGDFSGETEFLTSSQMKTPEALQKRTKISRSAVDTVLLMSDGVADDYFPNETEMRRLYYDLIVNGILDRTGRTVSAAALTAEQIKLLKRIPDPLEFPWVNDQQVLVPVQYTRRICAAMGLSLEDLWNDPTALELARMELLGMRRPEASDAGEQLKIWLDNYAERGSFDDRTLVAVTL